MTSIFDEYRMAVFPNSILDILPKELFLTLMQGFFYREQAGMGLAFDIGGDTETLQRLDPTDGKAFHLDAHWNPFCQKYREIAAQDKLCLACDEVRAKKAYTIEDPLHKYICHMGLWDMTYHLKVGGQVRGVLYAGQVITDIESDRKSALVRIDKKIEARAFGEQHDELKEIVRQEYKEPKFLYDRERNFRKFGEAIQRSIDEIYSAKLETAKQEVINSINADLSASLGREAGDLWRSVENVINELFRGLDVAVFSRRGSRYLLRAKSSPLEEKVDNDEIQLPVYLAIDQPQDRLIELHRGDRLLHAFEQRFTEADGEPTQLFRLDLHSRPELALSSLIFIRGKIEQPLSSLAASCCQAIAKNLDAEHLVQTLSKQRDEFAKHVAFVSHSIKTPLQHVLMALDKLGSNDENSPHTEAERQELVKRATRDIFQVRTEAAILSHEGKSQTVKVFDIVAMLEQLCDDFKLQARRRGNRIDFDDRGSQPCEVRGNQSEIRVALRNLIDNAIKYSYDDRFIRIRVESLRLLRQVRIAIENYGVGFSPEQQERILEFGERAEVFDPKRERQGSGLGLPHAIEIVGDYGGAVEIASVPADEGPRRAELRHITTVTVTFPTAK